MYVSKNVLNHYLVHSSAFSGRGTIFSLTKKGTVAKKEAQRAKLAEGTGLTEDFVCLENTIFIVLKSEFLGNLGNPNVFSAQKLVVSKKKRSSPKLRLIFQPKSDMSIEKEDFWLFFGCPRRTIHFKPKKRTNPLKRGRMVALFNGVKSAKNVVFFSFCILVDMSSSVARGGGRGGLEPPHWPMKYAKSHVFGAFEADFW